jgi:hypothetical protein
MTVTGKLCRNPFSTIKLPHEDGGSKAGFASRGIIPRVNTPFSPTTVLDLLLHARALCIQKAWERA